ncbi:MAG: precorrin-8X methylmutase [Chloroflexi bacterium]|nr:MAG: precorrin-8X methylmutase [Chloroflexota bacterium]
MLPHEIEQESFRIIRSEMEANGFSEAELAVVVRVIHATADFDFQRILRFHPRAIEAGIEAIRRGATIVTDVRMVQAGISQAILAEFGGQTVCDIAHPEVREQARAQGLTRSIVAMRRNAAHIDGGIVAIGNAPTALLEVVRLVREEGIRPALVVGMPVGFVKAAESKEELLTLDVPYITAVGRKGGSPVAAATVNALLRLARNRQ